MVVVLGQLGFFFANSSRVKPAIGNKHEASTGIVIPSFSKAYPTQAMPAMFPIQNIDWNRDTPFSTFPGGTMSTTKAGPTAQLTPIKALRMANVKNCHVDR